MTARLLGLATAVLAGLAAPAALGADFSLSGFGTLGYAQSNKPYAYQRFIDSSGTLRRDSVAGLQVDGRLTDQFAVTTQILSAPDSNEDNRYDVSIAWAFLSWRPTNDLLVRAGKQRAPLYLHSQTYNVGITYDFARLPTEMYSISPNNDFIGLSTSRSWEHENGEFILDGYWGSSELDVRFWFRDGVPPTHVPGAQFRRLSVDGGGLVLTHKNSDDSYRIGFGRWVVREKGTSNAYPVTYPFVSIAPGVGYFQVDTSLPGPGIPTIDRYAYRAITIGADIHLSAGFRVTTEFARSLVSETLFSTQSARGYVSVLKRIDQWTPYLTYAFLRSEQGSRELYNRVNYSKIPGVVPGAAQINAAQRIGADSILVYDQSSWAIGASYALSSTSKLKAELMRVYIRQVSSLVDAPPGSNIRNQHINVLSLSYNVVF